jgi:murein DD-endopeptidase MepM/ murein hydrolase activator NlpD
MRRLGAVLVLAAVLATSASAALPSAETPNGPGDIVTPFDLSAPPAVPEQRSYEQLLALWQAAGAAYGVPWQVLAAINKIETNFGENMGPSSAGAVGWMQFMPDTWRRWGTDGNGDGVADPWNPEDGVYSAARYLAAAGASSDLPRAVFAYNHAQWYVDDVLELAGLFGGELVAATPTPAAPTVEVFAVADRLDEARRHVARVRTAIATTETRVERLGWRRLEAEQAAGDPTLGEAAFRKREARATELALAEERALRRLDGLHAELDDAVARLEELRAQASTVAFARPGTSATLLGAPVEAGGYVFPVGGGPTAVSVGHDHHDYPAADIAAPMGSPLYALASGVVVESYPQGNGKCGIGFKLRIDAGPTYVYCHLSYIEPSVVPGAAFAAGAPVGLVGSTGNSTGPHLHLGFVPSTAYPQDEPWFQSFAGRAFRWQDDPRPGGPRDLAVADAGRVFVVSPS